MFLLQKKPELGVMQKVKKRKKKFMSLSDPERSFKKTKFDKWCVEYVHKKVLLNQKLTYLLGFFSQVMVFAKDHCFFC